MSAFMDDIFLMRVFESKAPVIFGSVLAAGTLSNNMSEVIPTILSEIATWNTPA